MVQISQYQSPPMPIITSIGSVEPLSKRAAALNPPQQPFSRGVIERGRSNAGKRMARYHREENGPFAVDDDVAFLNSSTSQYGQCIFFVGFGSLPCLIQR